jgi:hypothetical protein
MKGTPLAYALLWIGFVCLLPCRDVHSWTPSESLTRRRLPVMPRHRFRSPLKSYEGENQNASWIEENRLATKYATKESMMIEELQLTLQLFVACVGMSMILISWEDISMSHPMRRMESTSLVLPKLSSRWGRSTIRGMAFSETERMAVQRAGDLESSTYEDLPSYNEVMLTHRTDRIPLWNTKENDNVAATTQKDVVDSVRAIKLALLRIRDCEELAKNYEWDQLTATLNEKVLRSDLQNACYILKGADEFLPKEARDEIGFDWGSCAWRHCGALSDAQEAIDALEHQVGMLEPFECIYCLDVVERSLRDMLAVTDKYADKSMKIPDYIPIQRMSDLSNQDDLDRQDAEYMDTLALLRINEF